LPANFDFGGAGAPTLSSAADAVDRLYVQYNAADGKHYCNFVKGT
jgi:hypothetical protein